MPPSDPTMSTSSRAAIRCLTVGLTLFTLFMFAKNLRHAWMFDGDADMQARVAEYAVFRQGIYPNRTLEPEVPQGRRVPYSVYPPYALVMFVPFFEPGGKVQGRVVIELLSLVSLVAIAAYGYRLLRDSGTAAASLGVVAALAISGNGNVIGMGQFSIICAGALLMQIMMLERDRPLAAGAWWALAMLKPQIGVAFAGLFIARREWRGLALGIAVLGALSLAACWWTEVSPLALIEHWTQHMYVGFAEGYSMPSRLAAAVGIHPRVMHLGLAASLLVLVPILFASRLIPATRVDPLFLAAIASMLGCSLLYHLFYDNIMMFPLLFAAFAAAAHRPTPGRIAIAAAVGVSLWVPQRVLEWVHGEWLLRPAVWAACAAALFLVRARTTPADDTVCRT